VSTTFLLAILPVMAWAGDAQTLVESWARAPAMHPNIPDVSWAGWRSGEEPLPAPAVVASVLDHGAKPGDGQDDTAAFQAAIAAAAAKGGGAVLAPEGVWEFDGLVRITADRVVLRGAGSGRTVLEFRRPLRDILGRMTHDRLSQWSWSGGLVWMSPANAFAADGSLAGDKAVERWERWRIAAKPGMVAAPAAAGATTLAVEPAVSSAVAPGMVVLLRYPITAGDHTLLKSMAGHPSFAGYDWAGQRWLTNQGEWTWPVEVAAVKPGSLTLRQPLREAIPAAGLVAVALPDGVLRDAGVEGLTIRTRRGGDSEHNQYPGWNGIYLNRVVQGFVRDVTIENSDNGLIHASAKNTTVTGLVITGGSHHHATALRVGSHDNLIERFEIRSRPLHGINTENLSSGNVWRKGRMAAGTFDSHRALSFDLVRTDIEVVNDGKPGGAGGTGPFLGRRAVHWNIRITGGAGEFINQPEQLSMGALVGVQGPAAAGVSFAMPAGDKGTIIVEPGQIPSIPDLYEAQLQRRLAARVPGPTAATPQRPGPAATRGAGAKPPTAARDRATVDRWNALLATQLKAALAARARLTAQLGALGGEAEVTRVDGGSLTFSTRQGVVALPLRGLDAAARAGLAQQIAGRDATGAACAAFHAFAAGQRSQGEAFLRRAGPLADEVRRDLGLATDP
jgi:hypothetical protein